MTALRHVIRRHQVARIDRQRKLVDRSAMRSRAMLGAYGLSPLGQPVAPTPQGR